MIIDVKNMKGEKVQEYELPANIFEAPIYVDLMHQAYVRQLANARIGTHETKTRHEVAGGGRVHTPHMRDYTQAMPKKMRRAALRSALSVKASDAEIVVVDELKLDAPKTKLMAAALNSLVGDNSALVLVPDLESNADVIRATNNLADAKILHASYLNIRDLLKYDKVVLPLAAIDTIVSYLG